MKILTFLQESDGSYSWARLYSSFTGASAIWAFVLTVLHTHAIPDAATLAGLAGWAIHGYAANKGITAFAKKDAQL